MEITSEKALLVLLKAINSRIDEIHNMKFEFEDYNRVSYEVNSVNDGSRFGMLMSLAISDITGIMPERHGTIKFRDTTPEEKHEIHKRSERTSRAIDGVKSELEVLKYIKEEIIKELNI